MPISHAGSPLQYFLPLKISRSKKAPFCNFSVFVLFYVLFRNFPLGPKFFVHFRNIAVHFRNFRVRNWARNPRIYRNGRGRGICSDFVFILFILGNMIQKSEFVYYCRKKVKKSIAIKKNVVSLHQFIWHTARVGQQGQQEVRNSPNEYVVWVFSSFQNFIGNR